MKKRISPNKKEILIHPGTISGIVSAPPSKSMMQRAIALGLLAKGRTTIYNPSYANDSLSAINLVSSIGGSVFFSSEKLEIERNDNIFEAQINIGESGLGVRMYSSVLAYFNKNYTITGTGTLLNRPVESIKDALSQLNINVKTNKGLLPISISGEMKGGTIEIDGSLSSQVLTGLLITLPLLKENSELIVHNLQSKPYIDLTIQMISGFGGYIEHDDYKIFRVRGNQSYFSQNYTLEGDWSGASYLLIAGLIAGEINVKGLNSMSKQADIKILDAIKQAEGYIEISTKFITTKKSNLKAFEFDASDCPDLFPPLVVLAAYANGKSIIKGVNRLKHKESNRAEVLKNEFRNIGIEIEIIDDEMHIEGGIVKGGSIHSNNDHRIAMAAGIAALGSENPIEILQADSINKSYSRFFRDLAKLYT